MSGSFDGLVAFFTRSAALITSQEELGPTGGELCGESRAPLLDTVPPNTSGGLQTIENLLALQVRLHGISLGLERDGEALAHAKQDLAAVCRGELDEIRPGVHLETFDLADDVLGDIVADRVPDPAVDHGRDVPICICHPHTPSFARVPARYVAGAFLVPLRWLQRRAWVRRAGAILRPSGTTTGGAR